MNKDDIIRKLAAKLREEMGKSDGIELVFGPDAAKALATKITSEVAAGSNLDLGISCGQVSCGCHAIELRHKGKKYRLDNGAALMVGGGFSLSPLASSGAGFQLTTLASFLEAKERAFGNHFEMTEVDMAFMKALSATMDQFADRPIRIEGDEDGIDGNLINDEAENAVRKTVAELTGEELDRVIVTFSKDGEEEAFFGARKTDDGIRAVFFGPDAARKVKAGETVTPILSIDADEFGALRDRITERMVEKGRVESGVHKGLAAANSALDQAIAMSRGGEAAASAPTLH